MRRLFPEPAETVDVLDAYTAHRPRHPGRRPWVGVCMVTSVDGSSVVDGRSRGLSSPSDHQVLLTLRRLADVVLVGAGTVRAEGYGKPSKDGQRIGVVSRTGNVRFDTSLFTSGAGFLVLPEDAPEVPVESVRAGTGDVDLAVALARLPGDPSFVQAEGGATLNGQLLEHDLIDELNLSVSPQLVGGKGPRVMATEHGASHPLRLAHILEDEGFLFTRWLRAA